MEVSKAAVVGGYFMARGYAGDCQIASVALQATFSALPH